VLDELMHGMVMSESAVLTVLEIAHKFHAEYDRSEVGYKAIDD
jgi:hypothetical protein